MKTRTKLRLLGGAVLLLNLWLIGHYSIEGLPVLLMTFGFAIAYEYVVDVRHRTSEDDNVQHAAYELQLVPSRPDSCRSSGKRKSESHRLQEQGD